MSTQSRRRARAAAAAAAAPPEPAPQPAGPPPAVPAPSPVEGSPPNPPPSLRVASVDEFIQDAANPRRRDDRANRAIDASLAQFGPGRSILIGATGIVRAGNGTIERFALAGGREVVVVKPRAGQLVAVQRDDLSPIEEVGLGIADNRTADLATNDDAEVAKLLAGLQSQGFDLEAAGYSDEEFEALKAQLEAEIAAATGGGGGTAAARATLAERFGVPPFSILDARQGYWQERKGAWIALGIQSELGRGGAGVHEYSDAATIKRQGGTIGQDGSKVYAAQGMNSHSATITQNPDGSLNYGTPHTSAKMAMHDDPMQRKAAYDASPGGSPRPAMQTKGGHTVRGDGKGRPL